MVLYDVPTKGEDKFLKPGLSETNRNDAHPAPGSIGAWPLGAPEDFQKSFSLRRGGATKKVISIFIRRESPKVLFVVYGDK